MLEGNYIKLRSLEEDDLLTIKNWRNRPHMRKSAREYKLLNMLNQKNWFKSIHRNNPPKEIMFGVLNQKNKLIGVCGLTYIDWKNRNSEISIYFSNPGWQKTKDATETIKLLMKYGFDELNLHRLWVEIYSLMKENVQLFKKLKFREEGKLRQKLWRNGKWWDSLIYSKLSNEF